MAASCKKQNQYTDCREQSLSSHHQASSLCFSACMLAQKSQNCKSAKKKRQICITIRRVIHTVIMQLFDCMNCTEVFYHREGILSLRLVQLVSGGECERGEKRRKAFLAGFPKTDRAPGGLSCLASAALLLPMPGIECKRLNHIFLGLLRG